MQFELDRADLAESGVPAAVVAVFHPGSDLDPGAGLGGPNAAVVELGLHRREEVFGDDVVAAAMIDRLVHHAEVIALKGDSYRLKDRPREALNWQTPAEVYRAASVALIA